MKTMTLSGRRITALAMTPIAPYLQAHLRACLQETPLVNC